MSEKKPLTQTLTKRSFSYSDIVNMKSASIYSSIGKSIDPQLPLAPRATFGRQKRSTSLKRFDGKQTQKDLIGRQGIGPAAYLPPRHTLLDGKLVQDTKDPAIQNKYQSTPAFSIGKSQRKITEVKTYEYMKNPDDLDLDKADLKRKHSSSNILIGTAKRFSEERLDKITPGPTYDPAEKPALPNAPKYTMTSRKFPKGQDPIIPPTSTTTLVGPGSYFQKVKKSHSTSSLSRVPYDSKISNTPTVSFTKAPRTLQQLKNSVDQTYDIKSKTIMAHYDFEYDGGKGYQSGQGFMKKNLINSSLNPLQRNKMGSFTIGKASKEKESTKRAVFKNMMSQQPQSVRIQIPRF